MGFSIETSVSAVTVFLQGALSFFSPCVLPLVPLYVSYLAGGAAVVDAGGVRRYPRGRIFLNTLFFVVGISFAFFLLGLGLTALGSFFQRLPGVVRPGQRRHHPALRPVPAGPWKAVPGAGAGAPPPLPAGQAGHEPGHGPGAGLHLQLRLDALRGPHPQQRPADGLLGGVLRRRLPADRRVHPGLRAALPGGGPLHRRGAGLLQGPPERGALHGEDRRGAADRHGPPDPHRRRRQHLRRSGRHLRHGPGGPCRPAGGRLLRRRSGRGRGDRRPGAGGCREPCGPRPGLHPDGSVRRTATPCPTTRGRRCF